MEEFFPGRAVCGGELSLDCTHQALALVYLSKYIYYRKILAVSLEFLRFRSQGTKGVDDRQSVAPVRLMFAFLT